jgi:hypothetical protein
VNPDNVIVLGGKVGFEVLAYDGNRFLVEVDPPPRHSDGDVVTIYASDEKRMSGKFWAIKAPGLASGFYYAHRIPTITYPKEVQHRSQQLNLAQAFPFFDGLD